MKAKMKAKLNSVRKFLTCILILGMMMPALAAAKDKETIYKKAERTRADVEKQFPAIQKAFKSSPGTPENRRAYAKVLFELGNIWQANDVIATIATPQATNLSDLELGAELALLTMDLERSEVLHKRLKALSKEDSESYEKAVEGLMLTYFQANQYPKTKDLPIIKDKDKPSKENFLRLLKLFKGKPYQIECTSADKTAHLPFTNDIFEPGVLPYMKVTVNGHKLDFLLDTGGANLYLDNSMVEKIGVNVIQRTKNKYAYTNGEYVDEVMGSVKTVELDGVIVKNVPVYTTELKKRGVQTDGIVTTQFLKQFLSTMDYENNEITLRERNESGKTQFMESMKGRDLVQMPFFMASQHLMFAKGTINGKGNLNMFMDSGLAAPSEAIVTNETTNLLGLEKEEIAGTRYYTAPVDSVGLESLPSPAGSVMGNVFVEENPYWSQGFAWDGLISHQYLWKVGSWTIDFDTMTYYFPAKAVESITSRFKKSEEKGPQKIKLDNPEPYVGSYEVAPGVDLVITVKEGTLMLKPPGQGPIGITAFDDGTFGIPLAGAVIEFEGDPSTGVTALNMIQAGNTTHGKRK